MPKLRWICRKDLYFHLRKNSIVAYLIEMTTIWNLHLLIHENKGLCAQSRTGHFPVNRVTYGILLHYYAIIGGIFLNIYKRFKKNQQHLQALIFNFAWFYCRQSIKRKMFSQLGFLLLFGGGGGWRIGGYLPFSPLLQCQFSTPVPPLQGRFIRFSFQAVLSIVDPSPLPDDYNNIVRNVYRNSFQRCRYSESKLCFLLVLFLKKNYYLEVLTCMYIHCTLN